MSAVTIDLSKLGFELDAHGVGAKEAVIRQVVRLARAHNVGGVAVDVLADTAAPDVARLRAYAAVAASLSRLGRTQASPGDQLAPVA